MANLSERFQMGICCVMLCLLVVDITTKSSVFVFGETICKPSGTCSCEMSDGSGTIDLHPISSETNTPRFQKIPDVDVSKLFSYFYNPCKPFNLGSCKNVLVCQMYADQALYYDIGQKMSTKYDTSKKQLTFVYSSHSQKITKNTYIELKCDEKAETPLISDVKESPTDSYHSTLTTKYACPKKKTNSKKKLSVGSILCILLFVGLVLYLALGIVFNKYYRQKEGSEVIPNIEFWKEAPSHVKDGCLFSWTKARGKTSEYQQI